MELLSGIFLITFFVVLALTFALGIVVWLEVRPLQNIRCVKQRARARDNLPLQQRPPDELRTAVWR